MKQAIHSNKAPSAIGPYSQAIQVGTLVFLSGQIPIDPQTGAIISPDFRAQAEQVFNNIKAVCLAAGGKLDAIVKLTIYLTDLTNFSMVNDVMAAYFASPYPARVTIEVSGLPKEALIEVDAIMTL